LNVQKKKPLAFTTMSDRDPESDSSGSDDEALAADTSSYLAALEARQKEKKLAREKCVVAVATFCFLIFFSLLRLCNC